MSGVLAIIPARMGSKGIPHKNFRPLAGRSAVQRAADCCHGIGLSMRQIVLSTDGIDVSVGDDVMPTVRWDAEEEPVAVMATYRYAPTPLHTDDCPMIDVVKDVLARVPGPEDEIILLVQPTQPLRMPAHLRAAIALLGPEPLYSGVRPTAVVSVTPLYPKSWVLEIRGAHLELLEDGRDWEDRAVRRQGAEMAYKTDGTVYAFYRETITCHGNMFGSWVRPLIIPREETCALDTMADWAEAERRLRDAGR